MTALYHNHGLATLALLAYIARKRIKLAVFNWSHSISDTVEGIGQVKLVDNDQPGTQSRQGGQLVQDNSRAVCQHLV